MLKTIYGYIYQTENLVNGKKYVGQTTTKGNYSKNYLGSGICFKKALKKYGRENFEKTILSECFSKEELDRRERLFISIFKPEYNLDNGGQSGEGRRSEATKAKISASHKGKKHGAEWAENCAKAKRGKKQSPEHIKNKRTGMLGHLVTEECKQKISDFHKGKQWALGTVCSEETKQKISEANTGGKRTEECKKIMSEKKKGQKCHTTPHTQETKDKTGKKVLCLETGIMYSTIALASEKTGAIRTGIIKCCQGKRIKSGGFHWKYFEGNI